jgi:hypothetical protein
MNGTLTVNNTTDTTSVSTGAIVVMGGTTIQKNLNVIGDVKQGGTSSSNVTFYATYYENVYGSYGGGTLTPTIVGSKLGTGVALINNRMLVGNYINGVYTGGVYYVTYPASGNADFTQQGIIRFMYTPNYDHTPTAHVGIIDIGTYGSSANIISLQHANTGNLWAVIYSSTSGQINNESLGSWSPDVGTEHEITFYVNLTDQWSAVVIDGTDIRTIASTGTRTSTAATLQVGSDNGRNYASNFYIRNLVVYNDLTALPLSPTPPYYPVAYTPGYTLSDGYAFNTGSATLGYTLSAYNEYLLLTTFTGPRTTPTVTIRLILLNSVVFFYCAGVANATSTATYFTSSTPVPIGLCPPEDVAFYVCVVSNSSLTWGTCTITSAGVITIKNGTGNFVAGSCGWQSFSTNYTIS